MEFFRCQICGDVYIGATRPSHCPFCGAKGKYMVTADKWTDENLEIGVLSDVSSKNLERALQMEVNNALFYREASKAAKTPLAQGVFKGLAKVEGEHASVVRKILRRELPPPVQDSDLAIDGDNENLKLAHQLEMEATRLYRESADEAVEPRVKKVFTALSEIESDHVRLEEALLAGWDKTRRTFIFPS